jgi:hypothetical protein
LDEVGQPFSARRFVFRASYKNPPRYTLRDLRNEENR